LKKASVELNNGKPENSSESLNEMSLTVLKLWGQRLTYAEIAKAAKISKSGVKYHLKKCCRFYETEHWLEAYVQARMRNDI